MATSITIDDTASAASKASPAAGLLDHLPSTRWTPQHAAFRLQVRAFVDRHLDAHTIDQCERTGRVPHSLLQASYAAGIYAMRAPIELGGTPPSMLAVGERVDAWYEFILVDELSSCGAHGIVTELIGNFGMLLPILNAFASEEIRQTIVRPMIRAEIFACFAFTEPLVPVDAPASKPAARRPPAPAAAAASTPPPVRAAARRGGGPRMRTTATRCDDGSYIVKGDKQFVSFGARSDYIVTACTIVQPTATDGKDATSSAAAPAAAAALSLILVPSNIPGVTITPMPLHGWHSTSTTRISFLGVRVPGRLVLVDGSTSSDALRRLLFGLLQSNVTQERYVTSIMAHRSARICLEDALDFARQKRIGRDQRMIDSSVVRQQLVHMSMMIQQNQHLLESLTAHMAQEDTTNGSASSTAAVDHATPPSPRRSKSVAQQTALVKYACTHALTHCAHTASVICGSSAVARGVGPGGRIERLVRDGAVNATAGGNENILLEFVAKQAKL
jgi:acyl-CoA dehydrogenase